MRRRADLIATVVVGALGLVAVLGGPADRAGARARLQAPVGDELVVLAGWDSQFRPGGGLPVLVDVPDGTDRVTARVVGLGTTYDVAVTDDQPIARFTVATSWADTDVEVRATAWSGGTEVGQGAARAAWAPDQELVGVLDGLADDAPLGQAITFPADLGTARLVRVDRADLGQPGLLDAIDTLAAGPDDLTGLDAAAIRAVVAWVGRGGHLLVDRADPPLALPRAWRPTAGDPASAGMGQVRLTGGRLASGAWADEVLPTGGVLPTDHDVVAHPLAFAGPADLALASRAGVHLPVLGGLLLAIAAYAVLAGPGATLVTRRRPARLWLAVPVVALLAGTAVAVDARSARDDERRLSGASVLELGAVDVVHADLGWAVREPTDVEAPLPPGWTASSPANERSGEPGTPVEVRVGTAAGGRSTASVDLVGGEVGVIGADGSADATARLTVRAEASGSRVSGQVRNQGRVPLDDVAVFVGSRAVAVGRLEGGGVAAFQVDVAEPTEPVAGSPPEAEAWPAAVREAASAAEPSAAGTEGTDGARVDLARWAALLDREGVDLRGPGAVVAAGWASNLAPPVDLGGSSRGSTVVVSRQAVTGTGSWGVPREVLRGPSQVPVGEGREGAVVRFRVPEDRTLGLLLPPAVTGVEAWDGTGYVSVFEGPGSTDPEAPLGLTALPASARDAAGHVVVRVSVRADVPPGALAHLVVSP